MKTKKLSKGEEFARRISSNPEMYKRPTHTPTPWSAKGGYIMGTGGAILAKATGLGWAPRDIDAAFIVRAVNSHEMLLEALKDATRMVTELIPEDPEFPEFIKYKKDLLEAIAKAEGK